jgi:hypothetical protein
MRISRLIAGLALPLALAVPGAVLAQSGAMASSSNPAAVQSAVKSALQSVNLTPQQKLKIAPMIQNYKTQTAGADAATKKTAQENLLKNIYGVMTPDQQTKFKASLKSSLANPPPH